MSAGPGRKLNYLPIAELTPDVRNPRKHDRAQIAAIAASIQKFGFNAPITVDRSRKILGGHGRLQAAQLLGLKEVPVICLDDLTEPQARAYAIADNKLTDRSSWNFELLAIHFKELSGLALDFDIEDTGFAMPEIDLLIQGLDEELEADAADEFDVIDAPPVSREGDLWEMSNQRLLCGDALDPLA